MAWPGPCMHQALGGSFSWEYIRAAADFDAEPRGEVLACPGPDPYWTPERAADRWLTSPSHAAILYGDADANAVACGVYLPRVVKGSIMAVAVLCVTFRE